MCLPANGLNAPNPHALPLPLTRKPPALGRDRERLNNGERDGLSHHFVVLIKTVCSKHARGALARVQSPFGGATLSHTLTSSWPRTALQNVK
jgi:hypothetical protein